MDPSPPPHARYLPHRRRETRDGARIMGFSKNPKPSIQTCDWGLSFTTFDGPVVKRRKREWEKAEECRIGLTLFGSQVNSSARTMFLAIYAECELDFRRYFYLGSVLSVVCTRDDVSSLTDDFMRGRERGRLIM